jgi:ATP-dependent RNA helicase HelY
MSCHLGDAKEYGELRAAVKKRETELAKSGASQRRAAAAQSLEQLKVGDVIRVPSGRRSGLAVVLDPGVGMNGDAHPLVVTEDRWAGRLSLTDFPAAVEPVGHVRVPKHFNHRTPQARRDMASTLRALGIAPGGRAGRQRSQAADDETLTALRAQLRRHPVHGCDDREQHMRWAERWHRLRADTDALERRVAGKTSSIARTFDRVCDLLTSLGYLDGETVTATGQQLARVYSESDLLVVECLRSGAWDDLTAAELAAVASTLVYENRRPDESMPRVPSGAVQTAVADMTRIWGRLTEAESRHKLSFLREPDAGFTWAAWSWAGGARLEQVLDDDTDLTAGDFVRWCKQLVDLLSQVALVASPDSPVRATSRQAIDAVRRGVVAYSSVL